MQIEKRKMIGIVGGMGPYAGLDLVKKIFDLSQANQDQDHVPLAMISVPHKITDRTKFLEGETNINPGIEISNIVRQLSDQGASVIGMPCNTAHSSKIIKEVYNSIPEGITFVNMVSEVIKFIKGEYPDIERVGILATTGTMKAGVYNKELINNDLKPILLLKENHKVIFEQDIYKYLEPQQKEIQVKATNNNMEPMACSLGNDIGGGGFGVVSDNFSFLDMTSEDLSAKGNGGVRQMYNYAGIREEDKIHTPEDDYAPDKIGDGSMDKLQQQREADIKKIQQSQQMGY